MRHGDRVCVDEGEEIALVTQKADGLATPSHSCLLWKTAVLAYLFVHRLHLGSGFSGAKLPKFKQGKRENRRIILSTISSGTQLPRTE